MFTSNNPVKITNEDIYFILLTYQPEPEGEAWKEV